MPPVYRLETKDQEAPRKENQTNGRRRPGFVTGEPFLELGSLSTKPARSATTSTVCQLAEWCISFRVSLARGGNVSYTKPQKPQDLQQNRNAWNIDAYPSCKTRQVIYHIANKINRTTLLYHINTSFSVCVCARARVLCVRENTRNIVTITRTE